MSPLDVGRVAGLGALARIRIVLNQPTHPGNIGAVARAMKTMCLGQLYLVAPRRFPAPEANALAAGAEDVLDRAHVCQTLEEAVRDCRLIIGTSARSRRIGWPTLDPSEGAKQLITAAAEGSVALIFGQERTGLINEELDRCHAVIAIPANQAYSSINLAGSVQIMAYELMRAGAGATPVTDEMLESTQPATHEEIEHFYRHLEQVLVETGFLDPANPRLLMRRLRRLFNRAMPDQNEINILRGILTSIQRDRGNS
ncbi:MAG: RNA methyltransferase [Pseudomonadota bacterium]